ncbi:beta strand repeat-containing protein [Bartonella schoenbuchensis]|uniref:beta strand repeat-containing protein n=1 Tax=Bartonella schoenbuchensis TaxID=165694 RepID=UPI003145120A
MVMRRVFNHHVCLCVLSTAILAGLALMTSQTKVYAQAKNCNGVTNGDGQGDDKSDQPIVCDGGPGGTGGVLEGNRTIDMNVHSGETAVTITGSSTKITIVGPLKVWDSDGGRSSNDNMAIKVDGGGELTVDNADVTGVQKGIVVDGSKSSVTVVEGTIGVRAGGGPVIEVSSGGKVVLNDGVTVELNGGSEGEVVINNGGTLQLDGKSKINVKQGGTGLDVSNGTANVMGATITLQGDGSKGLVMKGGTVMMTEGEITAGGTGTGVEMSGSANVTLTRVEIKEVAKGITMTGGTLQLDGGTKIDVAAGGKGLDVKGGTANVMGATITGSGSGVGISMTDGNVTVKGEARIEGFTTGIKMEGGKSLTVEGGSITAGSTGTGTGISATDGSGNVTVKGGATITGFATGINMKGSGTLTVKEGTTINVVAGGKGVYVGGSVTANLTGVTITGSGTGVEVKGQANVTLTRVTMQDVKTGVEMTGNGAFTVEGGSITGSGSGTGINVTGGSGNVIVKGVNVSEFTTGIKMMGKGTLTVEKGTRIEFTGDYGVYVGNSVASTTLTNVQITGSGGSGSKGVWVMGGGVVMERVTITGVEMGIAMKGKGELKVEEGTRIEFTGSESYDYGVYVGSSVSKASLTGVTITGNKSGGSGVLMMGSTVTMTKVNISNVGTGVYAMGGSLTVKEGTTITEVEDGIKMMGGTLTVEKGARINFTGEDGYGVSVGKGVMASLTGVTITGAEKGVGIYAEGGVMMVKGMTTITGVKEGIKMMGYGVLTVKKGTRIDFMGDYGVYAGKRVKNTSLMGVMITGNGNSGSKGVGV